MIADMISQGALITTLMLTFDLFSTIYRDLIMAPTVLPKTPLPCCHTGEQIDGLVQDCSISSANALEILQSCIKPSK